MKIKNIRDINPHGDICEICKAWNHFKPCNSRSDWSTEKCLIELSPYEFPDFT